MNFDPSTIRARVSTRSFDGTPLSAEQVAALDAAFAECLPAPFGSTPRFALVTAEPGAVAAKMGTYGLITKVPAYVVGAVRLGGMAMEDFGYALEGIVLRATELRLGSCWLGGVFDRGKAARTLRLGDGEVVPAALALGTPSAARSLQDRIVYAAAGARRRKDVSELFFQAESSGAWTPLAEPGEWAAILDAVRIGPSASNKQPWRVLVEAGALHLYLSEDKLYNAALKPISLQNMDMGIALCHIKAAARASGLTGIIRRLEAGPVCPRGWEYIASWVRG
ncbi:MAG: nitroreductase family protein [Spirochaetaceae bacterium]|nr:nitroreductase family protein [Spirochaetaceae bacterium]